MGFYEGVTRVKRYTTLVNRSRGYNGGFHRPYERVSRRVNPRKYTLVTEYEGGLRGDYEGLYTLVTEYEGGLQGDYEGLYTLVTEYEGGIIPS